MQYDAIDVMKTSSNWPLAMEDPRSANAEAADGWTPLYLGVTSERTHPLMTW